jgi:putative transposase
MTCPHCESTATTERPDRTELGYRRFRCRDCQRGFNERTGTPFNRLQYPTADETYLRIQGRWCYLYRAIDRDGPLIDARLSDTRDLAAAEAFFRSAWTVTGVTPDRITTDGHDAYPRAIRNVFGPQVMHRTNRYLNNHLEQDHRSIKQRYRSTCGLKTFGTAARFCGFFDEIRAFFRPQSRHNQRLSLTERCRIHQDRFAQLMGMMVAT